MVTSNIGDYDVSVKDTGEGCNFTMLVRLQHSALFGDVAQLVERRTENPYVEGAHPSVPINLCYKLGRRRNPYASEFEEAVGWVPTDVSKAFKDRNLL